MRELTDKKYKYHSMLYFGTSERAMEFYAGDDDFGAGHALLHEYQKAKGIHVEGSKIGRGICDLCGNRFKVGVLYVHEETEEPIILGHVCAKKNLEFGSRQELEYEGAKFRASVADKKAQRLLDLKKYEKHYPGITIAIESKDRFISDVRKKYLSTGRITDRQLSAVLKAYNKREERKESLPAIEPGRQQISGTVSKIRKGNLNAESYSQSVDKVTILTPDGLRFWGTLPEGFSGGVGDPISIKATVTPKDVGFAFFSRPQLIRQSTEA